MTFISHSMYLELALGRLHICADNSCVTKIEWSNTLEIDLDNDRSVIAENTHKQLSDYFLQAHNDWTIPLIKCGTEFQQKVWHYLQTIPLGETRYYSDVAKALNSSAQAVGNACRTNPFVIVIPCHRVISKTGLGGYDGQTSGHNITIKQWLLDHERQ